MDRIRFGIIGSGYMAKLHSLALRNIGPLLHPSLPSIELVRMADIDAGAAASGAKRWGWRDHSGNPESVTRGDDIDVVIIITPNDSHAKYALDALAHGKHVFCEKPLAHSLEDAQRMTEAAERSGKVCLVNFSYRTWPGVEFSRQLISEGQLGDPLHFEGHFFQDYGCDPALPYSWRFNKAVSGGGAFADIGSHIMDIACTLMGPAKSIVARTQRFYEARPANGGTRIDVDDLTASLVEFASGASGSVHASWAATGHKSDLSFSVVGTKGSLSFSWERSNELHFYTTTDESKTAGFRRIMLGGIHPEAEPFWYAQGQGLGYGEAFAITARRMIEAVMRNDLKTRPSFSEALHISSIIQAAYQSAAERRWVDLPVTAAFAAAEATALAAAK